MSIPQEVRELVRRRANRSCEYCGITETSAGGELTLDHFRPISHGGGDEPDNLLYCCFRCNLYKADYWPQSDGDPILWNPLREPANTHFERRADGCLLPITSTGKFTIRRLRLNRPALIEFRRQQEEQASHARWLMCCRDGVNLLEEVNNQYARILEEQQALLNEQQALMRALLGIHDT